MSVSDVRSLSHYDFELLSELMSFEEQFQQKDIDRQYASGKHHK